MTTPRRDLARATYLADKEIDALWAPLSDAIGTIVRNRAVDGKITPEARTAILRDIDKLLDRVFPKQRGGPSVLQAMIERRAAAAAFLPVADAVAVMRRHVPKPILAKMGDTVD
jgi:hypothetical protein